MAEKEVRLTVKDMDAEGILQIMNRKGVGIGDILVLSYFDEITNQLDANPRRYKRDSEGGYSKL